MGIKTYKPTTPSRRYITGSDFSEVTKTEPEKHLLEPKRRLSGRNAHGHITLRRRGGGHKRRYRIVDFKRDKHGIPATVAAIEYDPNRSCRIALLNYADGEKRYILCPDGTEGGPEGHVGRGAEVSLGQRPAHAQDPRGHDRAQHRDLQGAAAGRWPAPPVPRAQLMAKEGDFATLRMPSGEMRYVSGPTATPPWARWATSTTRT